MTGTIAIVFLILLIAYGWWRIFIYKKAEKVLFMSENWKNQLNQHVEFYASLTTKEQKSKFEKEIMLFLDKVAIHGIGIEVEDIDKLFVASSAVIPIFAFPNWHFTNLDEVLLYKDSFNEKYDTQDRDRNILGMVGDGAMNRVMILSKPALRSGFIDINSKTNVGIHEFVHLMDKADGATDGVPDLFLEKQYIVPWVKLIYSEIAAITDGSNTDINPYGSKNEIEFFSVVSEYFFKQPELLHKKHPELFEMLERIFNPTK